MTTTPRLPADLNGARDFYRPPKLGPIIESELLAALDKLVRNGPKPTADEADDLAEREAAIRQREKELKRQAAAEAAEAKQRADAAPLRRKQLLECARALTTGHGDQCRSILSGAGTHASQARREELAIGGALAENVRHDDGASLAAWLKNQLALPLTRI